MFFCSYFSVSFVRVQYSVQDILLSYYPPELFPQSRLHKNMNWYKTLSRWYLNKLNPKILFKMTPTLPKLLIWKFLWWHDSHKFIVLSAHKYWQENSYGLRIYLFQIVIKNRGTGISELRGLINSMGETTRTEKNTMKGKWTKYGVGIVSHIVSYTSYGLTTTIKTMA